MHMADALVSPIVGGAMIAATVGVAAFSSYKVKKEMDEKKIPLMGVMGAFIFAAQMINFSIPGTGSSGHLGGGLLLAAILGPYAGFLSMAVILLIQALVFADGGLLAYGCNVFNLAFFASFVVYPLIFRKILGTKSTSLRIWLASLTGAIISLQLGAFSVVIETLLSGKTELPFSSFVVLMQPIHLAIGAIEGVVTGAILSFVHRARPEILDYAHKGEPVGKLKIKPLIIGLSLATIVTGGVLSWFASSYPDGLEWSMLKTSGKEELRANDGIHDALSVAQETTALLPDYGFKKSGDESAGQEVSVWPNPDAGTTFSGIIGGAIVFFVASCIGLVIWLVKRSRKPRITG